MVELENEENIKNTIQDTQMLIRNHMQRHKKQSKQLHSQIKKEKKTIELFKEKISKLIIEKKKLEEKQNSKGEGGEELPQVEKLKEDTENEVKEKNAYDAKIAEIQQDFLNIKNEMGGLNATQALKDRYEKHIKILENRLDKANQKFNDAIEYDKKLRAEIDKLRKERFFFENIYKKSEKELEEIRKMISQNLEEAYDNYEQRDINQENFENLKAQMIKKETEYTNKLSGIANEMNIRNTRKKSQEKREKNNLKSEDQETFSAKKYGKSRKNEQLEQQENLNEKYQNLKYKFEKLEEFTGEKNVGEFCEKFKRYVQQNFDLFLKITNQSNERKRLESDIKQMEEEIAVIKNQKNSKQGLERHGLIIDLKNKTQKLIQKKDDYETNTKKYTDDFQEISLKLKNLYTALNCEQNMTEAQKLDFINGVDESNVIKLLSHVESKLKFNKKVLEQKIARDYNDLDVFSNIYEEAILGLTPGQVNENMKMAFANMDIGKLKTMEKIKNEHRPEDFRLENLKLYSMKVADEVIDNVNKINVGEKKGKGKKLKS